jgi:hypothetical protein
LRRWRSGMWHPRARARWSEGDTTFHEVEVRAGRKRTATI